MTPIQRTIREQVIRQIRDEVVTGAFPAGSTLREVELAKRFGVSRGPIREACLQLSQEGFLVYEANRGVSVCHPPNPADRDVVASLRRQLEAYVVGKGLKDVSEDGIKEIKASLKRLESACADVDVATIAGCDMAFHETILRACGGDGLLSVWSHLCARMLMTYMRLENYQQVYQEHVRVFEAIQAGREQDAIAALNANIK